MNTKSCKAKARRLQNQIRDLILSTFPELTPNDVQCAIMGQSGQDVRLSEAARSKFPYAVEAKNQEKLNIWSALEQATENTEEGQTPLLVFSRNHSKTYVALPLEDFMKLVK